MKNNHCVPPCLRKFHKLGCIFFRKKIEKNQQNLVYRSKSDSEIIKLVKKAWKRKWLRNTEAKTFPSNYNGSFPLFNYSNSKEKLFRKTIHSSKCVHGKVKKNKQKMLKSTEEKTFKKYSFGPSPVHLINPQTTLVGRVKGSRKFLIMKVLTCTRQHL
nr:uncharacterized protein LOC106683433 [Halyomorpha halys]